MSWRNLATHAEETKAVKEALAAAGIKAKVGHGRGTAWSWLEINVGPEASEEVRRQALQIAKAVTGRSGEHNGEILILSQ